jgi:transcriptional regulator with XRE-family HTH domain
LTKESVAETLKRLRKASGLTIYQVGELVGKSGKTINGWENCRAQPDAEMLIKLCDIYGVKDILAAFGEKEKAPGDEAEKDRIEAERQKLLEQLSYIMDQMDAQQLSRLDNLTRWAALPQERYEALARIAEIIAELQ